MELAATIISICATLIFGGYDTYKNYYELKDLKARDKTVEQSPGCWVMRGEYKPIEVEQGYIGELPVLGETLREDAQ